MWTRTRCAYQIKSVRLSIASSIRELALGKQNFKHSGVQRGGGVARWWWWWWSRWVDNVIMLLRKRDPTQHQTQDVHLAALLVVSSLCSRKTCIRAVVVDTGMHARPEHFTASLRGLAAAARRNNKNSSLFLLWQRRSRRHLQACFDRNNQLQICIRPCSTRTQNIYEASHHHHQFPCARTRARAQALLYCGKTTCTLVACDANANTNVVAQTLPLERTPSCSDEDKP